MRPSPTDEDSGEEETDVIFIQSKNPSPEWLAFLERHRVHPGEEFPRSPQEPWMPTTT